MLEATQPEPVHRDGLPVPPTVDMTPVGDGSGSAGIAYSERLSELSSARWKQVVDVQRPYRWNLRRLGLGRVLDVGCGIGRNLVNLGGNGIGVDQNAESIRVCRSRGLTAFTVPEFIQSRFAAPNMFDSMLIAHVMEHVDAEVADDIVHQYLPYLRPSAAVVFITPQERGFPADPTHIRFVDLTRLAEHADRAGLTVERAYSFPLPRPLGKVFKYNEFVLVARTPA